MLLEMQLVKYTTVRSGYRIPGLSGAGYDLE